MRSLSLLPLLPLFLVAQPALGEEAQAPVDDALDEESRRRGDEILVVATRIRGQVDAPQPPVMTLDEADVAAYGADSLGELVEAVSPQTGSGRGRGGGHPVMLVNGQRIANFRELRAIPPEAIRRMEVLPEEVALRFGYPPNQRVINFILKEGFTNRSLAGEYNWPTHGGFAERELEGNLLRIDGPKRINIEAKLEETTMLRESERGLRQPAENIPGVAGDPDPARFRSILDHERELGLNASWSTGLGKDGLGGNLSLNAAIERSEGRGLAGLDTVLLVAPDGSSVLRSLAGPLAERSRTDSFQAGAGLNKPLGAWLLSATIDASRSWTKTRVDRPADVEPLLAAAAAGTLPIAGPLPALAPAGADRAKSRDTALASLATLAGSPFRLPAGQAALTLKAGFAFSETRGSDTQNAGEREAFRRGDLSTGFNISLPIASRKERVLSGIGDLSLNFGAGLNHLSDFGTLKDWNVGLSWSPTGKLGLQASYLVNEAAPSLGQLGNPEILSFNVPVYDFQRGEAALVTIIQGGNPGLRREKQRDIKLSANWELPFLRRSNLIVEYFRNRSTHVTQDFPLLTPVVEAAFPGRAVRDASGRLVSIDRRPVTFARIASSRIRWGVNLSGPLGKQAEGGRGGEGAGAERGAGRGPMAMMRRDGRGGHGGGRWNLSLYHTWRLSETATLAPGVPGLDLLGGDALVAGGVARHALELEGGVFKQGKGLRINGRWRAPAHVRGSGAPGTGDLRFGSTLDLDLRMFVNLGDQPGLVDKAPFLKGMRFAVVFENILDSRQKVTDGSGAVPLAYQRDYRDPRGRVIGIDLRKRF